MSLVVARQVDKHFIILSDTKLTYEEEILNKNNSHPQDSTIKALVMSPTLCICFAGETVFAEQAIKKLDITLSEIQICKFLLSSHVESQFKTEYLVINAKEMKMYEIKNGQCEQTMTSWIGSGNAFNRYQGYLLGNIPKDQNKHGATISIEMISSDDSTPPVFPKMSSAFDAVIDDGTIPEVDGFKVKVSLDKGAFKYFHYVDSYRSSPIEMKIPTAPGTYVMNIDHGVAAEGAYTVNFFGSSKDYKTIALHVQQGQLGIIFHRENNGLFQATLKTKIDEVDFIDEVQLTYGFSTAGQTQITYVKYWNDGNDLFKKSDFTNAILRYEKALLHCKEKVQAPILFNIGRSYLRLNDLQKAMRSFDASVRLDYSMRNQVADILHQFSQNDNQKR